MEIFPIVASEILTSGWCPLNCKYCYIPKTPEMKRLHANIIRDFLTDNLVAHLTQLPTKNLTVLGLWGTEPTLTLTLIKKELKNLKDQFPQLETISFSTNMMLPPSIIVDFAKECEKFRIKLDIQISLDGPAFITDKNRGEGSTEKIVEHSKELIRGFNKVKIGTRIRIHWKPTLTVENMKEMLDNPDLIHEYFDFFKNLTAHLNSLNSLSNIVISNTSAPTLVVPGKYTSTDGIIIGNFFKKLSEYKYPNGYTYRLLRVINNLKELARSPRIFTCSAGDTNIGFDGHIHFCHRSFYLNRPEYVESIFEMPEYQNWDVSHLRRGTIEFINTYYIVDPSDDLAVARFFYVTRAYHDFMKHRLAITYSLIKELAEVGQVSKIYKENDDYAKLLALFINTALSCPMENLLNTGSIFIPPVSVVRAFGNGAFEVILSEVKRHAQLRG